MFIEKPTKKGIAIIKLEILAFLLLASVFLKPIVQMWLLVLLQAILSVLFLFFLFTEMWKLFAKEFKAYAAFFLFLFAVIEINFAVQAIEISQIVRLQAFFAIAIVFFVFLSAFRLLFTKRFVSGKVLHSEKGEAIVEVDFDMLSMVSAGKYTVKSHKKLGKGKTVKLKVKQGLLGRKPVELAE